MDDTLSAGLSNNTASRTSGVASLASALSAATASLSSTDSAVSAALFNNTASRTAEVASLASALSAAKASLSGTDSAVSAALFNNTASRTAEVASLADALSAAKASLSGVDSTISAALSNNTTSRASGVASLATSLSAVASLLTDADSVLSAAISAESGNRANAVTAAVMAVVGGAPSTLDTLAEISALLSTGLVMHSMMDSVSAAVATNTTTRTASIQGLENSITAKELSFVAADTSLSVALSNNITSRISGVASVSSALSTAASSLTAADSAMSAALSNNTLSRVYGVASVATSLQTAAASLSAADSTLSAALSANVSGRASDIASLATSLQTAAASLSAVDSTLSAALSAGAASRVSDNASLSTAVSSHAHSLQTMDSANSATFSSLTSGTQLALLADTTLVNAAIAGLVGAAPSTLDTLHEIGSALNSGTDVITALNTILSNKADATQVAGLVTAASGLADQTSLTALETAAGTKAAASAVTTLQSTVTALGSACSLHTSDVSLMQTITGVNATTFNVFAAAASNLDKLYRYFGYVNADNTVKYKINNLADPVLQSSSLTFGINATTNALTAINQVAAVTFDPLQTAATYTVRGVETPITVTNGTYTFTVSSTGVADYTANATAIVVTGQESALRLAPLNALTIPKLALSSYTYATPTVQTPYAATTWNDSTGQITQALTFNYDLGAQRVQITGTNYEVAGTASILYSLMYAPGATGSITVQVLNSTSKLGSAVLTLSNVYNDYPQHAPPTLVDGSKTISLSGSTYTYSATFTSDATVVELHAYDAGTSTYSNAQNITSSGNSLFTVSRTYDVSRIGQPLFKLKAATSASKRASNFTSEVNAEAITFSQPVQSSVLYTTLSPGSYRLSATYAVHSMASAVKVTTTTGATLIASQAASGGSATFTLDFTDSQVTNGITIVVTTLANSYGLQSAASSAYALLGQYAVPVIVAGTKLVTSASGATYTYTANYTSSSPTGVNVYDSAGVFVSTVTTPGSGTFTVSYTYAANKIGQTAFNITSNADASRRESALLVVVGETATNTIRGLTLGSKSAYSAIALPSVTTMIKPTYGSTWNTVGSLINTAAVAPSAVAMSADGSVIAVGYPDSNAVYAYKKNASDQWVQLGNVINGPTTLTSTRFGAYVSMSANGRTLAIGTNKEGYRTVGGANGNFGSPMDIALDASGNYYVADSGNHRIQKFTKEGVFILQIGNGSSGSGDGQFANPRGITIDYNGYVYVSDTNNHRIQKFDSNGTFMLKIGTQGSGTNNLFYPSGIVSVGDFLYVCDYGNHRICSLYTYAAMSSIEFTNSFGTQGYGDTQFYFPRYIAFDNTRKYLIIIDEGYAGIRIYNFISQWGPVFLRKIYCTVQPRGVAFDPYGNIVVAGYGGNRIQVYTIMGKLVREYGAYGNAAGQFYAPCGVAVDAQGNIYVTEEGYPNRRVQIIEPASVSMHSYSTVTTTTTGTWSKLGGSLPCLTSGENNINMPVSLSGDGRIVAIGYPYNDGPKPGYLADNNGAVRVFKYSIPDIYSTTGRWTQLGNTIYGSDGDLLGGSVSLSTNGRTLAIGKGKIRHASNVISNNIGYVSGTARGIAFDSIGTMWVADAYSSSHSIKRFSIDISAGQPPPINILYGNGTTINTLNFNNPGAIVICNSDGTNTMYICDTGNHRIVRITSIAILDYAPTQSQYLQVTYIGSYGSAEGNFINPSGIATDAVGNFYVADLSNHRIQKFSHTGSYLSKFGSSGTAEGYFTNPIGIAIDVSGNIWVSDQHRIQIFNNAGTYLRKIGSSSYGSANEQFNTPHSIAFDKAGYVYISDYGNACIKQFTIGGTYVSKFGNNNNYTYLTIYKNKLYASYSNNNSVTVFSLPNTSVSVYTCPDDMWSKNGNNFSASAGLSLMGSVAISESLYPFGIGIMKTPAWPEGYAILVVEQGNNWVRFRSIDPAYGGYALTTGGSGSGAGQFNEPIGIAVHQTNHSSRIYVADTGNSRIQIWGTSTTNPTNPAYYPAYISSFGSFGYGDGNFVYPYCVAIHPVSGNVYVSDSTNRVQIFYPNGGYMNQFGGSNDSNPFNNPYGMAFDASGNILVVERNNNRVQKRTSTGTFISQFGSQGTGNGQFNSPHGIAIDENGYIYVGDFGNHRIQVFTSEGVYVHHVGTYGSGNGQFDGVGGITIYNGILYAVDRGGKRIHLYSTSKTTYSGDTWTKLGNDINLYDNVNDSSLTGPTVSLSGDGRCVAIGVNTHDGAAGTVADCGAVSVYKYSVPDMLVTNGNWAQLGDTLYGDAAGDMLGTSVAISTDGTIVAAGAPFNDGGSGTATDNRGKVIVRIYNSDTNAWTATSISGATGDYAGNTIALSSSGTAIAVGTNHSVAGSNWVKAYNLAQTDPIIYTSGNSAVAEVYGQIALSNSQGDAVITVTQTGGISSATMNALSYN